MGSVKHGLFYQYIPIHQMIEMRQINIETSTSNLLVIVSFQILKLGRNHQVGKLGIFGKLIGIDL